MNSSGIKRGLAATAVSALAVAGLPFLASSASANSYVDQIGADDARLYTQFSGIGSVQNDGTDTTVHLLAGGGTNVSQVQFQYTADDTAGVPVWVDIATVGRVNGGFSAEWTPPTSIYNLATVSVRAVPLSSVGAPIPAGIDTDDVVVGSSAPAVNIDNAAGSTVPVFEQPYGLEGSGILGVVTGKTSDVSGGAAVSVSNLTTGVPSGTNAATLEAAAGGLRAFSGVADFTGYTFDAVAPIVDQAVIGVAASGGSDDSELVNLTKQTIADVTATATPATVQTGDTATGVVTVKDIAGQPIAGAQVFNDVNNDGIHDGGETFAYTNAKGQASFTGLAGSAGGTQHVFIVNTDSGDDYNSGTDFRRTATVTSYTPTATTITATSHDGAAFDRDEYVLGDILVNLKDQFGDALAGGTVVGRWSVTAFTAGAVAVPSIAAITDNGDGTYSVDLPAAATEGTYTLNVWVERDGSPGESAGDLSASPLTVKSGEANVEWTDGGTAQSAAGSTDTYEGTLTLDDGTALPSRNIALSWTPTGGGNAVVSAQAAQPAGTTRTGDNAATAVTSATGGFAVALSDPAAPAAAELNGSLVATTATTLPAFGVNTDNSDTLDVDFLADGVVSSTETFSNQNDLDGAGATPGRPVHVDITVENAAGTPLTDLPVVVTTDHGFFTTATDATSLSDLTPDPAAAQGAEYGEWANTGATFNTTTDDNGYAEAVVAIERDAGFDDDGQVTANVTFTVGGKTFVEPVTFDSGDPLNGGEVHLVLAEDQSVTVLPDAPTTEWVGFNAQVTDQFGNLVGGEDVALSDDTTDAGIDDDFGLNDGIVESTFEGDEDATFYAEADATTDQTISGLWDNAPVTTWTDADLVTAGFQEELAGVDGVATSTVDITGSADEINWYVIDYAAASFTLTHSGAASQPVGTTVTMVYKAVDQNGEPLSGYDVVFFRTGPDDLGDGDGNSIGTTNAAGETTYVFQGAKAGTATVTAVLHAPDGGGPGATGDLIPQGQQTAQVSFAKDAVPPKNLGLQLTKGSDGNKDKIKVNANDNGAGLVAKVFRNGNQIAKHKLNGDGNYTFSVNDQNGNKKTKYTVKVAGTATTNPANKSIKIK